MQVQTDDLTEPGSDSSPADNSSRNSSHHRELTSSPRIKTVSPQLISTSHDWLYPKTMRAGSHSALLGWGQAFPTCLLMLHAGC